jgi:hypothetical protein
VQYLPAGTAAILTHLETSVSESLDTTGLSESPERVHGGHGSDAENSKVDVEEVPSDPESISRSSQLSTDPAPSHELPPPARGPDSRPSTPPPFRLFVSTTPPSCEVSSSPPPVCSPSPQSSVSRVQTNSRRHYSQDYSFYSNTSSRNNDDSHGSFDKSSSDLSTVVARHDHGPSPASLTTNSFRFGDHIFLDSTSSSTGTLELENLVQHHSGRSADLEQLPNNGNFSTEDLGSEPTQPTLLNFSDDSITHRSEANRVRDRLKQRHLSQRERFQESGEQFALHQPEPVHPPTPAESSSGGARSIEELSLDDLLKTQRISPIGIRAISESSSRPPSSSPTPHWQREDHHNHATSPSLSLAEILQEIENISSPTRPLSDPYDSFEVSPARHSSSPPHSLSSPFLRSPSWGGGGQEPRFSVTSSHHDSNFGDIRTRLFSIDVSQQQSLSLPHISSSSSSSDENESGSLTFLRESSDHPHQDLSVFSVGSRLSTHSLHTSLGNDAMDGSLSRPSDRSIGVASSQSTNSSFLFLGVGEPSSFPDPGTDQSGSKQTASHLRPSLSRLSPPSSSASTQSLGHSKDLPGDWTMRSDSGEAILFGTNDHRLACQPHNLSFEEKYGLRSLPADDSSDDEAHPPQRASSSQAAGLRIVLEDSSSPRSTSSSLSIPSFAILTQHHSIDGTVAVLPETSSSYIPSKSVWSPKQSGRVENFFDLHTSRSRHPAVLSHSLLSFNSNLSSDLSPSHSNSASPSQSLNASSTSSALLPPSLALSQSHHPPSRRMEQTTSTHVTHHRFESHRQQTSHGSFSFRDSTEEFESWLEGETWRPQAIPRVAPTVTDPPGESSKLSSVDLSFSSGSDSSKKAGEGAASSSMRLSLFSSSSSSNSTEASHFLSLGGHIPAQRPTETTRGGGSDPHSLSFLLSPSSELDSRHGAEDSSGRNSSELEGLPTEFLLGR